MKTKFWHLRNDLEWSMGINAYLADWHTRAWERGQVKAAEGNNLAFPIAATCCRIIDDDGNEIAAGYAFCSQKDQFSKKRGRVIAEGRAKKEMALHE